ncbi:hypothetical protein [Nonomuraea sp. 10N515B]|uniref:hypothetical protein n=1 Tax=Nonomuraea sp. 10N515B TaxID=3457422 RepID=UPI003FCE0E58
MPKQLVPQPHDDLYEELKQELTTLVRQAADTEEIRTELDRTKIPVDRLVDDIKNAAHEILLASNEGVLVIRESRAALALHENPNIPSDVEVDAPADRTWRGYGEYLFRHIATWVMLGFPVLVWQTWPVLSASYSGPWPIVLIAIAAIIALLCISGLIVAISKEPGDALNVIQLAIGVWVLITLLLVAWRLDALNSGWWLALWLPGGIFAASLGYSIMNAGWLELSTRIAFALITSSAIMTFIAVGTFWACTQYTNLNESEIVVASAGGALALPLTLRALFALRMGPRRLFDKIRDRSGRPGTKTWDRRTHALQAEADAALGAWRQDVLQNVLPSALKERIAELSKPAFTTHFEYLNAEALGQMRAGKYIVTDTATFGRFRRLMATLNGGAIGIAGPRGSGKSTLLDAYRDGILQDREGTHHIQVYATVPVRYEPREFALHLYASLCEAVLKYTGTKEVKDTQPKRLAAFILLAGAWLSVGYLGMDAIKKQPFLSFAWWPLTVIVIAATYVLMNKTKFTTFETIKRGDVSRLSDLSTHAQDMLAAIHFQRKYTENWSAKLGLLFGADTSRGGSREFTRHELSYPAVVKDCREFLTVAISVLSQQPAMARIPIAIIIDELDKITSSEGAQEFVNEVKSLFNIDVAGCLFLVSVSEEALATFERQGVVRDAFDSAFDSIFRVDYLTLEDSKRLLNHRIIGLPDPFICLAHCLSGGLPRDLIRIARAIVSLTGEAKNLGEVTCNLLGEDLQRKASAFRSIISQIGCCEPSTSSLMRHVDLNTTPESSLLFRAATNAPLRNPGEHECCADLLSLQSEYLAYLYFAATLMQVFGNRLRSEQLIRGCLIEHPGSFEMLTSARQFLSVNSRFAWLRLNEFREAWELVAATPPETLPTSKSKNGS